MSEHDVLNPTVTWQADIQDSMTPDFGFSRKRSMTRSQQKAVGGVPYTRELANTGHTFQLSWFGRTWACVQRLKRWQEQHEDGYFTLIDWDGGGRHYVGRFTSEIVPLERGNNMWDVQMVTFEEIATAPMLKYPTDWAGDGVMLYPFNDFGDQKLAANSSNWSATARTFGKLPRTTLDNAGGTAADWACYEYRGYGFRLHMLCGPLQGAAEIYLDGTLIGTANCYAVAGLVPQIVCAVEAVPLDLHRVQVTVPAAGNAPAVSSPLGAMWRGPQPITPGAALPGTTALSWFALEVMR